MLNNGVVNVINQLIDKSKRTLVTIANDKPMFLALRCFILGNLPVIIEIKIMLSIPNTISSITSVSKDNQISGLSGFILVYLIF
jgi:hypothetical protein